MAGISNFSLTWWYSADTKLSMVVQTTAGSISSAGFASIPSLYLDSSNGLSASVSENYYLRNTITNHPVETGVAVSDHIIPQPKVISITGLLTAIDTIPIVGTGILNFNQLGEAVQFFFNAYDERLLFTLTTGLYFGRSFFQAKNLAIESIDIPRTNQFGRTSIKFSIVFKEVVITDTGNTANGASSSQGSLDPNISGVP